MKKIVLYFGYYIPNYSRNRIIIKGLQKNKVGVLQCREEGRILIRYYRLLRCFIKKYKKIDAIIVGFGGHFDVPLAFILGKIFSKKIFFDIFTSKYETYVEDRKELAKTSLKGIIYFCFDWISLHLTDYIIVDTKEHLSYFNKKFRIDKKKGALIPVGSDDEIFYPKELREKRDVLFYGFFQPLHGTHTILQAARVLPEVRFTLIGYGQDKAKAREFVSKNNLKNVKFINHVNLNKLSEEINRSKIILGIFGNTTKARSVIPNKVYDGLASRKPIITGNTKAAKEILKNGYNCLLVDLEDHMMLKNAIARLLKNKTLSKRIAENGYYIYQNKLTPEIVVKRLIKLL